MVDFTRLEAEVYNLRNVNARLSAENERQREEIATLKNLILNPMRSGSMGTNMQIVWQPGQVA